MLITKQKTNIRSEIIKKLNSYAKNIFEEQGKQLTKHIEISFIHEHNKKDQYMAIFSSLKLEINTSFLKEHLVKNGYKLAVPKIINEDDMVFVDIDSNLEVTNISIFFVPGIAFDKSGNRLGKGKGYYDKFLSSYTTDHITIGVCLDEQIIENIPHEKHDIKMDFILSANLGLVKVKK